MCMCQRRWDIEHAEPGVGQTTADATYARPQAMTLGEENHRTSVCLDLSLVRTATVTTNRIPHCPAYYLPHTMPVFALAGRVSPDLTPVSNVPGFESFPLGIHPSVLSA